MDSKSSNLCWISCKSSDTPLAFHLPIVVVTSVTTPITSSLCRQVWSDESRQGRGCPGRRDIRVFPTHLPDTECSTDLPTDSMDGPQKWEWRQLTVHEGDCVRLLTICEKKKGIPRLLVLHLYPFCYVLVLLCESCFRCKNGLDENKVFLQT